MKSSNNIPRLITHSLFLRPVRSTIYFLKHASLPGCKGVPMWDVLRFFFAGIANGALWQRAKGLAYSFLTAIPPLLIFLFTLVAYLPVQGIQDEILRQLHELVPCSIYHTVEPTIVDVMSHRHSNLLSIGFIVSIILAAGGMHGMLMSFNYANNGIKENRNFFVRYATCLMLVFLLYILIILIVLGQVGYKYIVSWLFSHGILDATTFDTFLVNLVRWVILAFSSLLVIGLIYYWAPAKKQRLGFFSIGTVLTTLLLFGLTWGFQIYLNNFSRYNLLYGSIGTLLLIMLWIFLNCLVLLIGYEINISICQGRAAMQAKTDRIIEQNISILKNAEPDVAHHSNLDK